MTAFFAHTHPDQPALRQPLKAHLEASAALARTAAAAAGHAEFAYIAGLLHDLGKYSPEFQKRLAGAAIRVDHATAGAQEIVRLFQQDPRQKLMAVLLAYAIAGHHGGLPDYGSPIDTESDPTLCGRLKRRVPDYTSYRQEIDPSALTLPRFLPVKPLQGFSGFSLSFFTRMLYSALVDADFLDTETFMSQGQKPRGRYPEIAALASRLNRRLEAFTPAANPVNHQRNAVLNACLAGASQPPGFFSLTVPTGGGKTLASMAFALNHAHQHGLKRVIYVIPYTSIIEQNAAVFKNILGMENVLEHHANFDWRLLKAGEEAGDDEESLDEKLKLAVENWDVPVVVTTNVRFFESLFANRSSACRKLHNLAGSVLIFDEAQMLPSEYLRPCLTAVCELVKNYGATAVFCTATQPVLERFLLEGVQPRELAPEPPVLYDFFKRVQVQDLGRVTDADLTQRVAASDQALCIVNTRRHARGLYELLPAGGRFHLSTWMCPAHRKATIAAIRQRLKDQQLCRVISTQIMEAGIDVDFPVGFRAISGLDSIVQAAGRVNREKTHPSGVLYVFEPETPLVRRTPASIQQAAQVARKILRSYPDPVCLEAVRAYFEEVYSLQDPAAFDVEEIMACFEKHIPNQVSFDFKTAAEKFKVIDDATLPVIVPYEPGAEELIVSLRRTAPGLETIRALQAYTVNIFEGEYQALEAQGMLDVYHNRFAVLNGRGEYSPETGLVVPESRGGDGIIL